MNSPLKIGLAGLGTVGCAVISQIERHKASLAAACGREVKIVAVSARDKTRNRGIDLSPYRFVEDPLLLAKDGEIDLFVELMGGAEGAAKASVEIALTHKKAVVTANKALLAAHGMTLAALAEKQNVSLNFEAAVAGGIPVIKTLRESQFGNEITRVFGILNGTCNYILTKMAQEGLSFAACLAEAQRLGYAEADPTFDVDGFDTAHKLALLTSLAFGTAVVIPSAIEGIRAITPLDLKMADELGFRIKLLGVAQRTALGVEQRVHPTFVLKESVIGGVNGVLNAVAINGDAANLTLVGEGAGGAATASAVVADIADVARGHRFSPFIRPVASLENLTAAPMAAHQGGYYIRLEAVNAPRTLAKIATAMGDENISLESIIQKPNGNEASKNMPIVIITYATTEKAVQNALNKIKTQSVIIGEPQLIRIERP